MTVSDGVANQMTDRQRTIGQNVRREGNARGFFAGKEQFDERDRVEPGTLGSEVRGVVRSLISKGQRQVRLDRAANTGCRLANRIATAVFSHKWFESQESLPRERTEMATADDARCLELDTPTAQDVKRSMKESRTSAKIRLS